MLTPHPQRGHPLNTGGGLQSSGIPLEVFKLFTDIPLLDRLNEDVGGRLLTVNKAAPRGSPPAERVFAPSFRVYVGNLPWEVDSSRLEQVFSEHGKVIDAKVVYDRESGRSRGFGFVTMASETEVNDAIAALDGQSLEGRAIRVNVAEERPRRNFF
ncbi:hypothetical protein AgCh_030718 [Apium graveolens]